MNPWLVAAAVLMLGFVGCGMVAVWARDLGETFVAVQMGAVVAVLVLLLLAVGLGRPSFEDMALVLAVLNYPSGLLMARILEQWLR